MNQEDMDLLDTFSYDPKTGEIHRDGHPCGSMLGNGYMRVKRHGKSYLQHRLAWFLHHKEWPKSDLDHINRDKTDNRISNLREASRSLNQTNRRSQGYCYHKGMWMAYFRRQHLGYFRCETAAMLAHRAAKQNYLREM